MSRCMKGELSYVGPRNGAALNSLGEGIGCTCGKGCGYGWRGTVHRRAVLTAPVSCHCIARYRRAVLSHRTIVERSLLSTDGSAHVIAATVVDESLTIHILKHRKTLHGRCCALRMEQDLSLHISSACG